MTTRFVLAVMVLGAFHGTGAVAADIDRLSRECAAGKSGSCDELAGLARDSNSFQSRRQATERLIQARLRSCREKLTGPVPKRVRILSEYFFEPALDDVRRAQIIMAGDQLVASALLSTGLELDSSPQSEQAEVRVTLFGEAKAWLYGTVVYDPQGWREDAGLDVVLYPNVDWQGVVTVAAGGHCIGSEGFRQQARQRAVIYGTGRRKPSEAPFRADLRNSLSPALVKLGVDLVGSGAIRRMALLADAPQIRGAALSLLRDPSALEAIARNDVEDEIRRKAQERLAKLNHAK